MVKRKTPCPYCRPSHVPSCWSKCSTSGLRLMTVPCDVKRFFGTFQIPVDSLLTHTQRYTRFRQTNCSLLLPSHERCRNSYPPVCMQTGSTLAMVARIIDRGRGPEVAGTRVTVYRIMDFVREGSP